MKTHEIVIVGAGTAGITVAAQLLRKDAGLDIAIIEPSEVHYYQPAWTLVGGGDFNVRDTAKRMSDYMPKKAKWLRSRVTALQPEQNQLTLEDGETVSYKFLVLCPGIQIDWHKIKGLKETLGKNGVCSNYAYDQCEYTYECIRNLNGGTALFTNPNTPIKCGGAPQKIMYLACDNLRKRGLLDKTEVHFTSAGGVIFGVEPYKSSLEKVIKRYGIQTDWHLNLKEVRGESREAVYDVLEKGEPVGEKVLKFDMIHVVPPMSAPDFIKDSVLANKAGWVEVNKHHLYHPKFSNVFSLGDSAGSPNAKTGAAVRKQAPVVVSNLLAARRGASGHESYNGYGSCPLITGYGKLILAEFDYDGKPDESFPIDQSKERWSMYQMKKHFLPWMYWNRMLQGRA